MRAASAQPGAFKTFAWRLNRIEQYVITRTLMSVGAALAIIAALIVLIDFVDVSRTVGQRVDLSGMQILGLALLKAPNVILLLQPFAFLFGVLAAFVSLNRRSELVAMRAAGVSAWRFIFPAAAVAFAVGMLTVLALNPIASWLNGNYDRITAKMVYAVNFDPSKETWLRQGDNRNQMVIHAKGKPVGERLKDASFFVYVVDEHGRLEFSHLIEAREAVLTRGSWQLTGAREAGKGEQAVAYETLSIPTNLDPATAFEKFADPASVPFWALPETIHRVSAAGFSGTHYRLRLHQLLATPLLFAAMSILGAAFSLRLMRLGGLAMLASAGVSIGFLVFFFNELCGALGKAEIIPPLLAGWTPPILALLSAFTLLCYTEDG